MEFRGAQLTHTYMSARETIFCLNKVIDHCGPVDMDLSSSSLTVLG